MSGIPRELVEGLTDKQRELLLRRLAKAAQKKADEARAGAAPPPRRRDRFPLSFSQQRVWFFDQLVPGNVFFNVPSAVRIEGRLDVPVLARSLGEIVRRHESLRTTFGAEDGEAVQIVAPELALSVPVVDLRAVPGERREAEAKRLATEEARRPFDLASGPLMRVTVLRVADEDHALLLTMHHIVSDGWSMGVLIRELVALYGAFSAGRPSPLPEPVMQYADYAVRQREQLRGELLEEHLSFWRERLSGVQPLELPTDRPRPAVQSFRGARHPLRVPAEVSDALRELSRREGTSLFVTLLAGFQVLLQKYSGQDDIVVGSLIAGRTRPELEGLIGFFVNALVMRNDLAGNPTFREVLRRARQMALGAYAHQDLPLEKIVEELQPERDLSRHPVYQVHFVFQNTPRETGGGLPSLRLKPQEFESDVIRVDLEFHLWEGPGGVAGNVVYNVDLFDRETIARMVRHYETLLESIAAGPDRRLARLALLPAPEREQIVSRWNDTATDFPRAARLHDLFRASAERLPDAPALIAGGRVWSYAELDARSNQLARYLRRLGVGPETRVGVCVERSADMVVGLLGVLKAGAAYVPLDPAYPKQRLSFMLEDAEVLVLLTQHGLLDKLPPHTATTLCLDTEWQLVAAESEAEPESSASPDNLAYVIYTSGSTGRPKGVALRHRGVVNNLVDLNRSMGVNERDRTLAISSISFDMCVYEVFGTLEAGAAIVLSEHSGGSDVANWADLVVRHGVTVWNSAPALLDLLTEYVTDKPELWPRTLRVAYLGGDWIPVSLPGRLKPLAPALKVVALGGATEASIHSTVYHVGAVGPAWKSIPYGRPMRNQRAYVLDRHLELCPVGVPGELFLGGVGLARGYFKRPGLTAEKFLPDPFADEPGARIYKTGDLARFGPDGNIELLGRMDHQVKIRGLRIELGEIRSALMQQPQIEDAVAVVREDEPGEKRLVAYLVPGKGGAPETGELRRLLKTLLPDYMIPSAFVLLEALPLSPNGKVDRNSLPKPGPTRPAAEAEHAAPRDATERLLTDLWAEALGVERVGIHDNFFELGGDSILGIKLTHRAQQSGLTVSPRMLFQHQTPAELAAAAVGAGGGPAVLPQEAVTGPSPLTPSQHWFFEQEFAEPHYWNQGVILESPPALAARHVVAAARVLIAHHDALRLRFSPAPGGWRQHHAQDASVPFCQIDLTTLGEEQQRAVLSRHIAELHASMDLTDGPLMRVAHFNFGPSRNGRLLVIAHHLVVDAVSWGILLDDFQTAFEQLGAGAPASSLPARTTSFKRWAEILTERANSPEILAEAGYWTAAARARARPLPVDFEGGANTEASAEEVWLMLDEAETGALVKDVQRAHNVRVNEALLAALVGALSRWASSTSALILLSGHGREEIVPGVDLSRTVGWLTATYPVLFELGGEETSAAERLQAVKRQWELVPGGGLGYGLLRYLGRDAETARRLRELPRPEIGFHYTGQVSQFMPRSSQFSPAYGERVPVHSPRAARPYLVEVFCHIRNGRFQSSWVFSRNVHARSTIERVGGDFLNELREFIPS